MIYRFADCELDAGRVELRRGGRAVHVEPQVFEFLLALAERAGEVVDKDTLVARVWRGLAVSDATINARVSAARKAVGDDGARQAVIRTAQRRGFALVAEVSHVAKGQAEGASAAGFEGGSGYIPKFDMRPVPPMEPRSVGRRRARARTSCGSGTG
jgi:DNA-binding winged helix-turn-helix (wHTH) protein